MTLTAFGGMCAGRGRQTSRAGVVASARWVMAAAAMCCGLVAQLVQGTPLTVGPGTTSATAFTVNAVPTNAWSAVGISSTVDYDISVGGATSTYFNAVTDFCVTDRHFTPYTSPTPSTWQRYGAATTARLLHAPNAVLVMGATTTVNAATGVFMRSFDFLPTVAGTYVLNVASTSANTSWFVFAPNGSSNWLTRSQFNFTQGPGAWNITIGAGTAGYWHQLVVVEDGGGILPAVSVSVGLPPPSVTSIVVKDRNVYSPLWQPYGIDTFDSPSFTFDPIDTVVIEATIMNNASVPIYIGCRGTADTASTPGIDFQTGVAWTGGVVAAGATVTCTVPWSTIGTPGGPAPAGKPIGVYAAVVTAYANATATTVGASAASYTTTQQPSFQIIQPAADGSNAPVVLVHGYCGTETSFCDLEYLLEHDPVTPRPVRIFRYPTAQDGIVCTTGSLLPQAASLSVADIAGVFSNFLANCRYGDLQPVRERVSVVAHSTGGLVVATYLAGLSTTGAGNGAPLAPLTLDGPVFRFVTLGSPLAGGVISAGPLAPTSQVYHDLADGSLARWALYDRRWNLVAALGGDSFTSRVLSVSGVANPGGLTCNESDGVVSVYGADFGFVSPAAPVVRTEALHTFGFIPCLVTSSATHSLTGFTTGAAGSACQSLPAALSHLAIESFLSTGLTPNGPTPPVVPAQGRVALRMRSSSAAPIVANPTDVSIGGSVAAYNALSGTHWAELSAGPQTASLTFPSVYPYSGSLTANVVSGRYVYDEVDVSSVASATRLTWSTSNTATGHALQLSLRHGQPGAIVGVVMRATAQTIPVATTTGSALLLDPYAFDSYVLIDPFGFQRPFFGPMDGQTFNDVGQAFYEINYPGNITGLTLQVQWGSLTAQGGIMVSNIVSALL